MLEGRSELQLMLPDDAWIDLEVAPRELRRARQASDPREAWEAAKAALEIAEGGLLPGLEAPWIDARRAELADLRVEALETLAAAGPSSAAPSTPRPSRPLARPCRRSRSGSPAAPR